VEDGEEPRRRRRRGGRGRGRGRGRDEDGAAEAADGADGTDVVEDAPERVSARPAAAARTSSTSAIDEDEDEDVAPAPAPRGPKTTPFGSVWDSQIGTPTTAAAAPRAPLVDEEDFDEPEIPEYLIAEQRRGASRGGQAGGRGARGGRSAYQSAMERERYGRGSGGGGGGINRYPDVSGRPTPGPAPRETRSHGRGDRVGSAPPPRSSSEPWSDVPPELEAMLRAQVAQKPAPSRPSSQPVAETVVVEVDAASGPAPKPKATRKPAVPKTTTAKAPAKPRSTRKPAATATADGASVAATAEAQSAAPKPRATRKPAAPKAEASTEVAAAVATPTRRTTRKTAPAEPA
jgi:hypothetical protein